MSIISALRTFLATCPNLESGALLLVDHTGSQPIQYAIIPLPGERIVERYLSGSTLREYPFLFQTAKSSADDLERIETAGFQEAFSDWLEAQTDAGNLPDLGAKKTPQALEAVTWGFLYEQGESDTAIYQMQCKLTYEQQP
jgi:hypothetical protein